MKVSESMKSYLFGKLFFFQISRLCIRDEKSKLPSKSVIRVLPSIILLFRIIVKTGIGNSYIGNLILN
jgi:hypothetical protein